MESIHDLGKNCFDRVKPSSTPKKSDGSFKIVEFGIAASDMCWIETFSDIMIEGDDNIILYYLPYSGYAPGYNSGNQKCALIPTDSFYKGSLGSWFKPNGFGGSCGFMLLLGVNDD